MKIDVQINFYSIRVLVDDIIHVYIPVGEFKALQAWYDDENNFSIEYTLKNGKILSEYNDRGIWEDILKQLNKKLK